MKGLQTIQEELFLEYLQGKAVLALVFDLNNEDYFYPVQSALAEAFGDAVYLLYQQYSGYFERYDGIPPQIQDGMNEFQEKLFEIYQEYPFLFLKEPNIDDFYDYDLETVGLILSDDPEEFEEGIQARGNELQAGLEDVFDMSVHFAKFEADPNYQAPNYR